MFDSKLQQTSTTTTTTTTRRNTTINYKQHRLLFCMWIVLHCLRPVVLFSHAAHLAESDTRISTNLGLSHANLNGYVAATAASSRTSPSLSAAAASLDIPNKCAWHYNGTNAVRCELSAMAQHGLDLQGVDGGNELQIICNSLYMVESQLPTAAFIRLQTLETLRLEYCKLLQLTNNAFEGLNTLKTLIVNTYNLNWAPSKTLELYANSLNGLKQLTVLDLSLNNIRLIPHGFLCPVGNLQVLNLTHNRIRAAENLGFAKMSCNGGSELQVLDASHNELRSISESWGLSRLRRLQHLNLQHNNLSQLSGEALAGLSSLRILNLSYNHLETLPDGLFAGSKELREIHLQHNGLYELPKGLFHRLEQLLVVDLSSNQLTSNHIDNTTFAGLIRLIVLNLAHNALTRLDYRTFKELYFLQILNLRNNSIGHIEEKTFLPLYNLHTLNLAENRLHTVDDKLFNGLYVLSKLTLNNNLISVIEANVFKNCSDLKELDLSSNQLTAVPRAIQELSMLRTLDLGENQIRSFDNQSFKNLRQLTGLRMIDNQIANITVDMFADLPRLSVLNLAKNRIQTIERGSFDKNLELEAIRLDRNFLTDINGVFATLVSLLWLNLSENHLVWFDYAFIPSNLKWLDIHGNYIETLGNYYKLQEEIRVKTLDASHNRLRDIGPMNIPNTIELLFINNNLINIIHPNTFVDKVNLARVDLYANNLNKLQLQQLRVAPIAQDKLLPEFYLGGNPFECDCTMDWLQRVNNLTTRQHPRVMDLKNIECVMPHTRGSMVRSLMSLQPRDFLCRYESHCFALCHCCDFDACDCEMTCPTNCSCYHDQIWSTNVVDCGGQKTTELPRRVPMDSSIVFLDGNNFPSLNNHAFIGRKNLKTLYVNNSQVVDIQNRTFAGLISLQILHLEDNQLKKLHGYEFDHLSELRELYLHNNQLHAIDNATFITLAALKVLRLDGNRFVSYQLFQLKQMNFNLTALSLGRNLWTCHCSFLQDLTSFVAANSYMVQDTQDIYCLATDKKSGSPYMQKHELDFNSSTICSDFEAGGSFLQHGIAQTYLPLIAFMLIFLFLLVVLLLIFIFRESLRIWLLVHYGVRVFGARCEDSEKLYDAVVLHSAKDSEYVCQSLGNELVIGRPPLRICFQYRDLAADVTQYQLLEATRASRRLIIILTRNYLQTEWSRPEIRRAVHEAVRGRPQKLVIIEDPEVIFEAESDIDLLPYLKTPAVHRICRSDMHFFEKVRYALPVDYAAYHGNNYTIEHNSERIKQPISPGLLYRQAPPPAYCSESGVMVEPQTDQNYSSATTATPSPRSQRRCEQYQQNSTLHLHNLEGPMVSTSTSTSIPYHLAGASPMVGYPVRPASEHLYSSIDADYSTLDNDNIIMVSHTIGYQHQNHPAQRQWRVPQMQQQQPLQQQQQQQQQQQLHEETMSSNETIPTVEHGVDLVQQEQQVQAYLV